ncbi:menaquinone via futalosine step 1 [Campylobacter sp. faydin G-105]|uniref:MqnA/MqnD/SBP family protein n=1 Tax=Campylobacter anatolicus TaxID=2829105 RepID=UPI001B9C2301|nr:MqnA/MqnD/SBP family protein [Campylobacter anatolicus]MBR8462285.1 menaquinone via futalosine step 1 [Campylobacter anatolicus]
MLFGKIDYLNLLPFHIFLKRSALLSYVKKSIEHNKGVPSHLNKMLLKNRIDAAVISSVESRHKIYKKLDFGIVAKGDVKSVLVRKSSEVKLDSASATSNMLSKILGLKGEVIIGDRALKAYVDEGSDKFYDMGQLWHKRTNLPFVFARFCYRKNAKIYKKLSHSFLRQNVKIPSYILNEYAKTRDISPNNIKWYLKFISYKIRTKEKKALFMFLNRARALNFKP